MAKRCTRPSSGTIRSRRRRAPSLTQELGAAEWARRCGSVLTPSFTITKLAWLRDTNPDAYGRVRRVLLPHEWLTWQLLGRPLTAVGDRGDASGTGWWSPSSGEVDEGLLALVDGQREWLPEILGPNEPSPDTRRR